MVDQRLLKHYQQLFLKYGDGPEAAQYSDQITQERRFVVLCEIAELNQKSILDFGCGTAHLATFLKENNINIKHYTGVDIVPEMLACAANKHPEYTFCNRQEALQHRYDYVFVSGVFNNIMENNREFYRTTIKELFQVSNEGLAFNMMSSYVDYYDENLFYEKPEEIFRFLKEEVSPFITIRNDYQLKKDIIPFEFAVYVYKKKAIRR